MHLVLSLCLSALFFSLLGVCAQEADTAKEAMQKKPWTITASLREEYDDNIFTSNQNKKGSFKTEVQPSILLNYPLDQTLLSFRYTYDGTYYYDRPGNKFDSSHELVGRINHSFSSRFNIDARERFRYSQEPELFDSSSTLFRNGNYINNTASIQGNAQWTPKFGTVTAYTNDLYKYEDDTIGTVNDRMVHTVTQDFRFLVLPTVTVVGNITFEDVNYDKIARSYEDYIIDGGADWAATPQLTLGGRVGASITSLDGAGTYTSPYGLVNATWVLGARSLLEASYTHAISQTDLATSFAQETDTVTLGFKYQITARFAAHIQGIYTHGAYDSQLVVPSGGPSNYTEDVAAVELNGSYKYNEYLSFEAGYNYTVVSSGLSIRDYDRNRIYVGVRGTY